ncbi:AcrR family transcriptional regulator [Nocardioides thalensis]|uniref:AcrR family transcriptional regulator n=1 Tax=Nocardioides thalensis TaxID=1914755 RepID=A0A853BVN7_9ACTN|nr:TetR/AcrR family transcriptional regulator [Nocardioides thalensis]NYI99939.1 AcrR family transcriptional regulator [Nocardioides thalensis]
MPKVTEEHRAARRDQILRAALRCVAAEGFHKTTMGSVIRESGLSAGAVYLYFRSKQDLIRAIAETAVSGIADTVDELAAADDVVPPVEAVTTVLRRLLEMSDELGVEIPRLSVQAWAEAGRDPEIQQLLSGEAGRIRQAWISYAGRAIEAGYVDAGAGEVESVAETLMAMVPGFMLFRIVLGSDVSPERYTSGLAALLR